VLQNAGVSWQTYHNVTSYVPESLDLWANFQNISAGDPLYDRGLALYTNNSLAAFLADAEAGTLPQVSYVVAPQPLQEHPPYGPSDGGWLQKQVVDAVMTGAKGKTSAIILSYDGKSYRIQHWKDVDVFHRIRRLDGPRHTIRLSRRYSWRMARGSVW
jgi:phospholipase C